MNARYARYLIACLLCVGAASPLSSQSSEPREQLIAYLNGLARVRLDARARAVSRITTRAAADERRREVRRQILALVGGLPDHDLPTAVETLGTVAADGFRMEKIAYQSLPGLWVTANVYVPADGAGPFPAVVIAPGHGAGGKSENWSWGGNFARNGIIALAYDPIGQGERIQYYDPERKASIVGNPTGEHGEANIGPLLIGDSVARYMVNDAVRGIDYLVARTDVDRARIGAFGCSGGGTATALLAALDERIAVAASACYITSFAALLASATGVQEAEQSLPRFIAGGLDFPDWIEGFAPKPYAVVSTEEDMFPFAGARQSVAEAQRFYALYGARDRVEWITGPGGHGNLAPIAPAILSFFTRHLKRGDSEASFAPLRAERTEDTLVTPTGQVSTSFGGETVYSINRARAALVAAPRAAVAGQAGLVRLRDRLRTDVRALTGAVRLPGTPGAVVRVLGTEQRDTYRLETIALASDGDMEVAGRLAVPNAAGRKAAALLMDAVPVAGEATGPGRLTDEVDRLGRSGVVVMTLQPRPAPPGTESLKSPFLGLFNLLSLRAFLVGRTLVGLRVDDVVRAMDWLTARPDVGGVTVHGVGPHGIVALHAAVLDRRIARLVLEHTIVSYRTIVEQPVHRNVSEIVVPGVLRHYDTDDLLLATYPRPVRIIAPVDALGAPLDEAAAAAALEHWRAAERAAGLGAGQRIVLAPPDR